MIFPPKIIALPVFFLAFVFYLTSVFGIAAEKEFFFTLIPVYFLIINSLLFSYFFTVTRKTQILFSIILLPNVLGSAYGIYFFFFALTFLQKRYTDIHALKILNYVFQVFCIIVVSIFPVTEFLFKSNKPLDVNKPVPSYYLYWTEPYQEHAWWIREDSEKLAAYTDPRILLEDVINKWRDRSPSDEMALIEVSRFAMQTMDSNEAFDAVFDAYLFNQDSDILSLWVMRAYVENNQFEEALDFLNNHQNSKVEKSDVIDRNIKDLELALKEISDGKN